MNKNIEHTNQRKTPTYILLYVMMECDRRTRAAYDKLNNGPPNNFINWTTVYHDTPLPKLFMDAWKNHQYDLLKVLCESNVHQVDYIKLQLNSTIKINKPTFDVSLWEGSYLENYEVVDHNDVNEVNETFDILDTSYEDSILMLWMCIHVNLLAYILLVV